MLGTRERCILIMSDILNIIDIELAKEKMDSFINNTNYFHDIDEVIYKSYLILSKKVWNSQKRI